MSSNDPSIPASKSKPVLWLGGIAAACTALVGIMAQPGLNVPPVVVAVVAGVATLSLAIAGYLTQNVTVPNKNVAARYVDQTGQVVAGPAAVKVAPMAQEGDAVQVTSLPPVD